MPLVDAVIRYAVEPDLAVRPWLHAGPFDAVVEILGLARREVIDHARRATAATRIDAHAGIVVRHPFLRIDNLPVLVLAGRAHRDVRMLVGHALPRARIALLEGQSLGIGTVAQDHRIFAHLRGSKDIRPQHQSVIHCDRDIPVDVHAVTKSAARLLRLATAAARPVIAQRHELLLKPAGFRLTGITRRPLSNREVGQRGHRAPCPGVARPTEWGRYPPYVRRAPRNTL